MNVIEDKSRTKDDKKKKVILVVGIMEAMLKSYIWR